MSKRIDLSGQRFCRLLVTGQSPVTSGSRGVSWECKCDCGNMVSVFSGNLRRGFTTSCGCRRRELSGTHSVTHGYSHSAEHRAYFGMKARCSNPKYKLFHRYGGRGIRVCDRWADSFSAFLADMGPRPDGMSLDRINNDGNYEPGNCRWTTPTQQARNTRRNRPVTHNGETLTVPEWAERTGISPATIHKRLQLGWVGERLFIPLTNKESDSTPMCTRCEEPFIDVITALEAENQRLLGLLADALAKSGGAQ